MQRSESKSQPTDLYQKLEMKGETLQQSLRKFRELQGFTLKIYALLKRNG